jgi:hypothetical protein
MFTVCVVVFLPPAGRKNTTQKSESIMTYYDYQKIPVRVADEAFADFIENSANKSILDLLADLIRHCDAWCAENRAFSEQDHRVDVIHTLQAYLHETYAAEMTEMMRANITKYRQQQEIAARLHERRN